MVPTAENPRMNPMTNLTPKLTKGALGTVAAGAMALASFAASATPAMANDRHRDRGVDAGDVIAGAVIIGGIAALAGAFDGKRDGYDDRRYNDRRFNDRRFRGNHHNAGHRFRGRGGGQRAVERCIRGAERQARRFGGYRFADVTQIRDVEPTRLARKGPFGSSGQSRLSWPGL
jgi:hypothetical protein